VSAPPRLALPHLAPPRRGGTLVLVAVLLTVLVGCAALAVDLARAYGVRTQLRTVADAAALSAATDLARTAPQGDAVARALQLRSGNRVGGTVLGDAGMGAGDVVPGTWDFTAGAFTPSAWAAATAVRATARHELPWTFARIFGTTGRTLTATAIAALGSPRWRRCLTPWAVPYSNLLVTLGRSATDTAYRLTAADVAVLRDGQLPIVFKVSSTTQDQGGAAVGGSAISGNYYAVRLPPVQYANGSAGNPQGGASVYRDALGTASCMGDDRTAGVGDWLDLENGNMTGPTRQGVQALCGGVGNSFSCNVPVFLPVWNARSGGTASAWVQVLYVGAFVVTQFNNGTVTGYLTALAADRHTGGFQPQPGPVMRGALVQ
jgi:hypothetical protein